MVELWCKYEPGIMLGRIYVKSLEMIIYLGNKWLYFMSEYTWLGKWIR